jgi:hypothetical protein
VLFKFCFYLTHALYVCDQSLESMEVEFRASCKKKRAELVARIKQLQDPALNLADQSEQQADVEAMYEADFQKLRSVRKVRLT